MLSLFLIIDIVWCKVQSFKDAYGVENLKPGSISDPIIKIAAALDQCYRFTARNADPAITQVRNEEECKKKLLCAMVASLHVGSR